MSIYLEKERDIRYKVITIEKTRKDGHGSSVYHIFVSLKLFQNKSLKSDFIGTGV